MAAASTAGLGDPIVDPPGAKVDIIFINGICDDQKNKPTSTTAWPPISLPQKCGNARVSNFTFHYRLHDFYPESHHTGSTIDTHSNELLASLKARAKTVRTSQESNERDGDFSTKSLLKQEASGRPIIFVARELAGLVWANALPPEDDEPNVMSNTRGVVFVDTPFEGNSFKWAKVAKELPVFEGLGLPSNLKDRSSKLIEVHKMLLKYLAVKGKNPLMIRYFCENGDKFTPSTLLPTDTLEEISGEDYENVGQVLSEWVDELSKTSSKAQGSTANASGISIGDTHYHQSLDRIYGVVTGGVASTASHGVIISGATVTETPASRNDPASGG